MSYKEVVEDRAHWIQKHTDFVGNLEWEDFDEDAQENFRAKARDFMSHPRIGVLSNTPMNLDGSPSVEKGWTFQEAHKTNTPILTVAQIASDWGQHLVGLGFRRIEERDDERDT